MERRALFPKNMMISLTFWKVNKLSLFPLERARGRRSNRAAAR